MYTFFQNTHFTRTGRSLYAYRNQSCCFPPHPLKINLPLIPIFTIFLKYAIRIYTPTLNKTMAEVISAFLCIHIYMCIHFCHGLHGFVAFQRIWILVTLNMSHLLWSPIFGGVYFLFLHLRTLLLIPFPCQLIRIVDRYLGSSVLNHILWVKT